MAYSSNPITVERMMPYLGPLLEGRETIWRTEPNRSRWLAYRIREALAIAQDYPERFPALAGRHFRVEVLSSREVRARRRELHTPIEVEMVAPSPARMETSNVNYAEDIINHWSQLAPELRTKVYFANADLGPDGLRELWEWAQEEGVLIFENAGAITLLPKEGNEDSADFAFDPSDLEEEPNYG